MGGLGPEVLLSLLPRRQTEDYTALAARFTLSTRLIQAGGSAGRPALNAAIWARISR